MFALVQGACARVCATACVSLVSFFLSIEKLEKSDRTQAESAPVIRRQSMSARTCCKACVYVGLHKPQAPAVQPKCAFFTAPAGGSSLDQAAVLPERWRCNVN